MQIEMANQASGISDYERHSAGEPSCKTARLQFSSFSLVASHLKKTRKNKKYCE